MRSVWRPVIFVLFFISGCCSLIYQLLWIRLVFTNFGVITPNFSLVLSIFMAGLGLGSWGVATYLPVLCRKTRSSPLLLYAQCEMIIGVGAFVVPSLLKQAQGWLLHLGEINSLPFLFVSGILMVVLLLPWCVMMGATIPLMMAFLERVGADNQRSFGFLYLANVGGALFGTVLTSFILIELIGIRSTSHVAGGLNFFVAAMALILSREAGFRSIENQPDCAPEADPPSGDHKPAFSYSLLVFITGFVSMGQEVVLTRLFTPLLGTNSYAFAGVLSVYLFATGLGAFLSRRIIKIDSSKTLDFLLAILPLSAIIPIFLNDIRLARAGIALMSIVPVFTVMGILLPGIVDRASRGSPRIAGRLYSLNLIGCILGPLFVGYILLPVAGARWSLFLLAVCFLPLWRLITSLTPVARWFVYTASAVGFILTLNTASIEEGPIVFQGRKEIRRDHTATVVSIGEKFNKELLVNGVLITILSHFTKAMGHMPMACSAGPPKSVLNICFGMGTTYRSLLSWDARVTAVELVPSVKEAFGYYFEDASSVLQNPLGQIVIDDGRRFLQRTQQKYDVITIDPPPPVEAELSGLLYSREFYELAKLHLTDGGIMQQWFPGGELAIMCAVAQTIAESFPYVRAYRSYFGPGIHFLASNRPIEVPTENEWLQRLPLKALEDLVEWDKKVDAQLIYRALFSKEIELSQLMSPFESWRITDDRPFNEYFLMRRIKYRIRGFVDRSNPYNHKIWRTE